MRVVRAPLRLLDEDTGPLIADRSSYVTVGVFDGVHRGHQQLINGVVNAAREADGVSVAYTFNPHPLAVVGREPPPLLTTVDERAEILERIGLDFLLVPPFTREIANTPARDFIAGLARRLTMTAFWAGPDFGLGHRRQGNISVLREMGEEIGFDVHVIEPLTCMGWRVSSTRIRAALSAGDVLPAKALLGRPYRLLSVLVGLRRLPAGRFSLLTVCSPPRRLVPGAGVYASLVSVADAERRMPGLVSVAPHDRRSERDASPAGRRCELLLASEDLATRAVQGQRVDVDFVARLHDVGGERDWLSESQAASDMARTRALLEATSQG